MLEASKIQFSYPEGDIVLEDVSFKIEKGGMLGIIGPNGGGKTTLLKILVGLLPLNKGTIFYEGKNLRESNKAVYVPQTIKLNDILPIKVSDFLNLSKKHAKMSLNECLSKVGILDKKESLIRELSGGQKQRVMLARALRQNPEVLILDEPTTGLDGQGQDQLMQLLKDLQKNEKTTIVVVDHNLNQVLKHADKVLCLNRKHHWHERKELLTQNIINDIYHCEFEHIRLHEAGTQFDDHHHECKHDHDHHHEED